MELSPFYYIRGGQLQFRTLYYVIKAIFEKFPKIHDSKQAPNFRIKSFEPSVYNKWISILYKPV